MRLNYKGIYIEDINAKEAATLLRSLSRVKYDEKEFDLDPEVADAVEKKKSNSGGAGKPWEDKEIAYLYRSLDKPMKEVMASPILAGRKKPALYGIRSAIKSMNPKKMSVSTYQLLQRLSEKEPRG